MMDYGDVVQEIDFSFQVTKYAKNLRSRTWWRKSNVRRQTLKYNDLELKLVYITVEVKHGPLIVNT